MIEKDNLFYYVFDMGELAPGEIQKKLVAKREAIFLKLEQPKDVVTFENEEDFNTYGDFVASDVPDEAEIDSREELCKKSEYCPWHKG